MSVVEELATHDIPFTGVEAAVVAWVHEALELRHGAAEDPNGPLGYGPAEDSPSAWMAYLTRVRMRSDRVDELLSKVTQAKGRAKRAQDQAQFVADIAYDEAARVNAARRPEFSSARERHADASLDSLEQRRIAHHAARLVSVTAEAYEVVNQVHWQLDAIRKDARSTLHALQFESSLER
jgi:hypothetical protein